MKKRTGEPWVPADRYGRLLPPFTVNTARDPSEPASGWAAGVLRAATIAVSLVSLPFILPHILEDFTDGIAQRVGLSTGAGGFLLGGFLALQSAGLILLARGRRHGFTVTFMVGLAWVTGALVEHGAALLSGHFRAGVTSIVWVAGLLLAQAACTILSALGFWRAGGGALGRGEAGRSR